MALTLTPDLLEGCDSADIPMTIQEIAPCLGRGVKTVLTWLDRGLVVSPEGTLTLRQVGQWMRVRAEQTKTGAVPLDSRRVYFMEAVGSGYIKIGISGTSGLRINQLQTGCPFPLQLLAEAPGGLTLEQGLHTRFQRLHFRGEWFRDDPELRAVIAEHAAANQNALHDLVNRL